MRSAWGRLIDKLKFLVAQMLVNVLAQLKIFIKLPLSLGSRLASAMMLRKSSPNRRMDYYIPLIDQYNHIKWKEIILEKNQDLTINLIIERDGKLLEEINKSEQSLENFLMFSNVGAAVAVLGIATRIPDILKISYIQYAVICFVSYVIFFGFVKAIRIARNYYFRGEWRKNSRAFFFNTISLNELPHRDSIAWRNPLVMIASAWMVFFLFFSVLHFVFMDS